MAHLIIGSRDTRLALCQYNAVKAKLERLHPGLLVGFEVIKAADAEAFQAAALEALSERQVDVMLHDLRELPCVLPLDFHLAVVTERVEAREALVVRADWQETVKDLAELPAATRIEINSAARRAQLLALERDWQLIELDAPLEMRLRQLEAGEVDALLVAQASLSFLGEDARAVTLIEPDEILPVAGQGALALQTRLEDQRTNLLLEALNHWPTRYATEAERAVAANLPDAQYCPVAALARLIETDGDEPQLLVTALLADPAGQWIVRQSRCGSFLQGELLGYELALELLQDRKHAHSQYNGADPQLVIAELFPAVQDTPSAHSKSITDLTQPAAADEPTRASATAARLSSATASSQQVTAFTKESVQEFDLVSTKARRVREQKPFYDQHILIARAARHNAELVTLLETLGAAVSVCPTARLSEPESWEALDHALLHLSWYEWITFVSAPSVTYFLNHYAELGHHRSEIEARRICAVGERTAAALRAAGIQCDLVLEQFTAEHLAEAVSKAYGLRGRSRGMTMLLVGPQTLNLELNKVGIYAEAVAAFRLVLPETGAEALTALREDMFNYVIFNGESSVENLVTLIEPQTLPAFLHEVRVLCSNEDAGEAAQAHGLTVHLQPSESSMSGLVRALREDRLGNLSAFPTLSELHIAKTN